MPCSIPHEQTTLDNGLTVIVSEDRRVPLVNVRMWYRAGAQEGPYAHLFEHVFWTSEDMDRDFKEVLPEIGAVIVDANTQFDRTNYFETVPPNALDAALWLEASRMRAPTFPPQVFETERSIVRNEISLRKNRASYRALEALLAGSYPHDHPYARIGATDQQLQEATVEDMRAWHRAYYGAANATLLLTGDVSVEEAFRKAEMYFGDVRPGPAVDRTTTWIARRTETRRRQMTADVSAPEVYMAWNVPPWGTADVDALRLGAHLLADHHASKLQRRLVETAPLATKSLATDIRVSVRAREISSLFIVEVTACPEADLTFIERVVREEIERVSTEGFASSDLERAKANRRRAFAQEREHLGRWTDGISNILARGHAYCGDPDHYQSMLDRTDATTPADVARAARAWLADGAFVLTARPEPSRPINPAKDDAPHSHDSHTDQSRMPSVGPLPDVPAIPRTSASLANGLNVVFADRGCGDLVTVSLLVPEAGYASDPPDKSGQARLLLSLLEDSLVEDGRLDNQGTGNKRLDPRFATLSATVTRRASMDLAWLQITALRPELESTLQLLTNVMCEPNLSDAKVEEARTRMHAEVREETQNHTPKRLLPPFLYKDTHPYGRPFTGTGTHASLDDLTPSGLRERYAELYRPRRATLVVVGPVSPPDVMPLIEETVGTWRGEDPTSPQTRPLTASQPRVSPDGLDTDCRLNALDQTSSRLYAIDQPGADLAQVYAAQLMPPHVPDDRAALLAMRSVLGDFTLQGRLNRNLRIDKGWTYNACLITWPRLRGPEPIVAYTPVQADQAASAMQEILGEWRSISGDRPVTSSELQSAKQTLCLNMMDRHQTLEAMTQQICTLIAFDLLDDYYATLAASLDRLTPAQVTETARQVLRPEDLVWVVVGDLDAIGSRINGLGWGDMQILGPETGFRPPSKLLVPR